MPASRLPLFESALTSLPLVGRGKVRDIYAVDEELLLIVASDRLSAFDVVLPDPIPGKGEVLTAISNFWFRRTEHIVPNHLTARDPTAVVATAAEREQVAGRSVVVRRLRPLPIEAVVRAYLIGSGWREYQATRAVCGIGLPEGLRQADRLPEPIFTPSTKAPSGSHDVNVDFDTVAETIGRPLAEKVRDASIAIFRHAAEYAASRGIIIADTKMEFGLDAEDRLVLIDELLTPDSSRFWPAETYAPGTSPPSFDKQYVRDYLETLDWNKEPPAPTLPGEVIDRTASKYRQAYELLTGEPER